MSEQSGPLRFRTVRGEDIEGIAEVCYRTGYHGEDLTGSGRFNDRRLFALLFSLYYPLYEPENGFVAADNAGAIVGYCIGTADSRVQAGRFRRCMLPRILLRALAVSWWRHPESFRELVHFNRVNSMHGGLDDLYDRYPAHLHINLLPACQSRGAGSELLALFESRVRAAGARGIHLVTSERNLKALPFYRKHGYAPERTLAPGLWSDAPDARAIVFVKDLRGAQRGGVGYFY